MKIDNKEMIRSIFRDIGIELDNDILDNIINKNRKQ